MTRRRWMIVAIPVFCLAAVFLSHPRPTVFNGKTVGEWFEEPDVRSRGVGTGSAGIEAFLEMRGDAVPFLLRVARKGPNYWSLRYTIIYASLPADVQAALPPGRTAGEYQDRRTRALYLLGTLAHWERQPGRWGRARPPVPLPEIRECLREGLLNGSGAVRMQAAQSVGSLGAEATPLIPGLIVMLDDPNDGARVSAIEALGAIGAPASNSVLRLSRLLPGAKDQESLAIIRTLGALGPAAAPYCSMLIPIVQYDSTHLKRDAALTLAQIGVVPPEALPVLSRLAHPGQDLQLHLAAALALWAAHPSDPARIQSLSNTASRQPYIGLGFMCRVQSNPQATNLLPLVQSFAGHAEPHVARSASELTRLINSANPSPGRILAH